MQHALFRDLPSDHIAAKDELRARGEAISTVRGGRRRREGEEQPRTVSADKTDLTTALSKGGAAMLVRIILLVRRIRWMRVCEMRVVEVWKIGGWTARDLGLGPARGGGGAEADRASG